MPPPLGEHCAQVWFKSIQPSWRSSIFSQLWTTDDGQTPRYDNTSYGLWPDELTRSNSWQNGLELKAWQEVHTRTCHSRSFVWSFLSIMSTFARASQNLQKLPYVWRYQVWSVNGPSVLKIGSSQSIGKVFIVLIPALLFNLYNINKC